uniref:IntS14_C domain-containing protein n=1 Tax=Angiostrongylus cantonensis TaxID=6313 RepID=A0A0K0DIF8_ANGCA
MVVFFILDSYQSSYITGRNEVESSRNKLYVQIIKEILVYLASRSKEFELEVFWGNTSCVRSTATDSDVLPTIENTIASNRSSLQLGRLFNDIRSRMKPSDAIVLLTDAATFRADITSYPLTMIFAIVVDVVPPNSDQISELKELVTTTNDDKFSCTSTTKSWILRYSEFSDVKSLVSELMKSLLEPDYTVLYVGNLSASVCVYPTSGKDVPESIEVIGFVRLMNMMNIPVHDVQFITPSQGRNTEKRLTVDDKPGFVRTEEQDDVDLLGTIGPALLETECVAIALIDEAKYGCITAEKVGDDFCLVLNKFPSEMPDFVPDFATLISGLDDLAGALHFTTLKGIAPSYGPVVQSWVTEHGFNIDFQKIMRLLRKLPERPHLFYQEVNRFRNYALAIGMDHALHEAARIIREEIAQLNAMAQKHGAYVATAFGM